MLATDDTMARWMAAGERLRKLDPVRFELVALQGMLASVDERGVPIGGANAIAEVALLHQAIFGTLDSVAYLVTEIVEVTGTDDLHQYLSGLLAVAPPDVLAHVTECARKELEILREYLDEQQKGAA